MSKKLTTMDMMKLAQEIGKLPRKNRDQIETMLRDARLVEEAEKVARHNLTMLENVDSAKEA